MKLKKIYRCVVEQGIKKDPRGLELVKEQLSREKEAFEKLSKEEQAYYDRERLVNPYSDTRIFFGDPETEVKSVFVGIDVEVGELVLVDRLREKGTKIDLVITHHPEGSGLAHLHELLEMHIEFFARFGVPIQIAEALTQERQSEIARRTNPLNHYRSVDAARILGIPFLGVHTPSDNHVTEFLQKLFDEKQPRFMGDILKILKEVPEYEQATREGIPPFILLGKERNRAGKICVDMTGGTEGSEEIYSKLSENGVGTVVAMHVAEGHFKKARDARINLVIAGHIASDSLGLNLLLDKTFEKNDLILIEGSGFRRVDRRAGRAVPAVRAAKRGLANRRRRGHLKIRPKAQRRADAVR